MRMKKHIISLFLMLITTAITGCSTPFEAISKIGKVIWEPSTPVGEAKEQASTVSLVIVADEHINPNHEAEATPVQLQIVYMNEDSVFASLDQDQLLEAESDLKKLLKKNYIDHQDYTILPGQYKPLPIIKLNSKNNYIGVIAYYSDANIAQWKKILKIQGNGRHYYLLAHIKVNEIEFRKEEDE